MISLVPHVDTMSFAMRPPTPVLLPAICLSQDALELCNQYGIIEFNAIGNPGMPGKKFHRQRQRGRSKYGLWDRLWVGIFDLFGVMWLQARVRRPVIETDP